MKNVSRTLAIAAMAFCMAGCQLFTAEHYGKIEKVKENTIAVGSSRADRRIAVGYYLKNPIEGDKNNIRFCAEPLPDVGFKSFIGAVIQSSSEAREILKASLDSKYESKKLFERNPVNEFYKAGLFALCQMASNHNLQQTQVENLILQMLRESSAALRKSIEWEAKAFIAEQESANKNKDDKKINGTR